MPKNESVAGMIGTDAVGGGGSGGAGGVAGLAGSVASAVAIMRQAPAQIVAIPRVPNGRDMMD
jgi:hypothetical protein